MKKVRKERVSRYRKRIIELADKLKHLCLKACHDDLIFKGTPIKVYRKCGKSGCRCEKGGTDRHGPYSVIQTWHDGKQRQISLKQSEEEYFEMAQRHQFQQQNRNQIIEVEKEILKQLDLILEARTICTKK